MNIKSALYRVAVVASLFVGTLGGVSAATISYSDFSDPSSLTFNGDASLAGGEILLTSGRKQSGSVFTTDPLSMGLDFSFSAFFSFIINNNVGFGDKDGSGADGIVFAIQNVGNTAGGAGGGLGYSGINNSLGIEFDTYNNGFVDDNDGNHVGVNLSGSVDSVFQQSESTRFNNGEEWYAWVDYNGQTNELFVSYSMDSFKPASHNLSLNVDLSTILTSTNVFVGFTSGTGSIASDHYVKSLSFSNAFEVSSPPVVLVSLLALIPMLFRRKNYEL